MHRIEVEGGGRGGGEGEAGEEGYRLESFETKTVGCVCVVCVVVLLACSGVYQNRVVSISKMVFCCVDILLFAFGVVIKKVSQKLTKSYRVFISLVPGSDIITLSYSKWISPLFSAGAFS